MSRVNSFWLCGGFDVTWVMSCRCNRRDVDTTTFKVEDLTEGDEYEFRVMAYNEAGPSRPSSTAGPVLLQDQTCKNRTLSSLMKHTTRITIRTEEFNFCSNNHTSGLRHIISNISYN